MLIYLYGYLAIGVVVVVVIFTAHLISRTRESDFVKEMQDAIYPERNTLRYRILNIFVIPLIVAVAGVAVWPAAFYLKGKELWGGKECPPPEETEKEFSVTESDLLETLSITEIEARERIVDPMGATPDSPFGHLNAAWLKFKETMEPQDSISSFSAQWSPRWGSEQTLAGYVIVRDGRLGSHFLTARRPINDD
ncbi:MAG: hypothetical protein EBT98_12440 [Opitutaceae bacterium]|nr:hypothetical protein [Opitutaceae bacterium]